ncbi:MAG: four helix bundle protein [Bacteroidota bacterium]
MAVTKFEDLLAWQRAQDLAVGIYQHFGKHEDYGFRNQICRAVVSISNNVAEGFERKSQKEFIQYLHIALGSAAEVRSMLYLAVRLEYLSSNQQEGLLSATSEVSRLIAGLLKSIKARL